MLCHADVIQPYVNKTGKLPNPDALWMALEMAAKGKTMPFCEETLKIAAARAMAKWTTKQRSA